MLSSRLLDAGLSKWIRVPVIPLTTLIPLPAEVIEWSSLGVWRAPLKGALMIEQIEKHERLQDLAEVGRAHQTDGGALRPTTGTTRDLTYTGLCRLRPH
jgi:hypothetical protein